MSTYVLVHGAWHGSWCWKRVRKALQALGHEVFTPTLTGVGQADFIILSKKSKWLGHAGAIAMGFFDFEWQISKGSIVP